MVANVYFNNLGSGPDFVQVVENIASARASDRAVKVLRSSVWVSWDSAADTSAINPTPDAKSSKADIAVLMSVVGCIAEVDFIYIDEG